MANTETLVLNMGPQHPSTHGVLRVILELDGEVVKKAIPCVGYLHRGVEKIAENKTYHQVIPLTDRLDYLSAWGNNLAYVLAVEKLLGIEVPKRAQYIRAMMAEFARIASHLLWLGTHAHDLGAMTPIFYTLRDREMINDIFEMVGGARMTPSFLRIGGLAEDLPEEFEEKAWEFVRMFPKKIDDYHTLLTKNKIWLARTKGVGVVSAKDAIDLGLTGPSLRGSGVMWDIRKAFPYSSYDEFEFDIPVGENGDVFDRYMVRMEEMRQSLRIIEQILSNLPDGRVSIDDPSIMLPPKEKVYSNIEALIHHFKLIQEGIKPPKGEVYASIESPRGELGFYIVSDGSPHPYRMKIRSPSFINVSALSEMVEGSLIADVVAVIGSIDIVLGEVDR